MASFCSIDGSESADPSGTIDGIRRRLNAGQVSGMVIQPQGPKQPIIPKPVLGKINQTAQSQTGNVNQPIQPQRINTNPNPVVQPKIKVGNLKHDKPSGRICWIFGGLVSVLAYTAIIVGGVYYFIDKAQTCSRPIDCHDIKQFLKNSGTGLYTIFPLGTYGFKVRCDMDTTTGGWTVIQRRVSNAEDFYKTWNEYQTGFGDLNGIFWLGNQHIHMMTSQGWYKLRIDMTHSDGTSAFAEYNVFKVGDLESNYKLTVDGYHGTAGDNLFPQHNGMKFTTRDRDNDISSENCATKWKGGWWYYDGHISNLNGVYGNTEYAMGLTWHSFTGYYSSLSFVEMKIQRWVQS